MSSNADKEIFCPDVNVILVVFTSLVVADGPFYLCVYCVNLCIYLCSLCTVSMHANWWSPWINIYSMPRSVVINRTPAREILLSLSLESPYAAQPRVRWSSDRDASFTHVCLACVVRSQEYVCLSGCGRLGRSPPIPLHTALPKD